MSISAKRLLFAVEKGYTINNDGILFNPDGQIVNGQIDNNGYKKFSLRAPGLSNGEVAFHRLQAFQKYGNQIFEKGIVVRHFDSDKLNNSFSNILIGTHSENMMDIDPCIRLKRASHASSFIRKYDKNEVKAFYQKHRSYSKTMSKFKISSKGTLHFILNN